jgi:hypothetical protein
MQTCHTLLAAAQQAQAVKKHLDVMLGRTHPLKRGKLMHACGGYLSRLTAKFYVGSVGSWSHRQCEDAKCSIYAMHVRGEGEVSLQIQSLWPDTSRSAGVAGDCFVPGCLMFA